MQEITKVLRYGGRCESVKSNLGKCGHPPQVVINILSQEDQSGVSVNGLA